MPPTLKSYVEGHILPLACLSVCVCVWGGGGGGVWLGCMPMGDSEAG